MADHLADARKWLETAPKQLTRDPASAHALLAIGHQLAEDDAIGDVHHG